jgi:hypothetical protein
VGFLGDSISYNQRLENDRYLKPLRLIEQFEDEITAVLRQFDQQMVDQQPDLFDKSTDPGVRTNRNPSNGLANTRIDHTMDGPLAPDNGQTLKLNVHLYWMPPEEYARRDVDGALRAFGYKIKHADPVIDDRVVEQTRTEGWSIETSGNPFDSNTVFYRHVGSVADIEATIETLVDHFAEFGGEYAKN